MSESPDICVVLSTCPQEHAERLASLLVERRFAACVNILPTVTSIYRWEGKINKELESLLVAKCPSGGVAALTAALAEAHPYDVPEILSLPVARGFQRYLEWVVEECRER